LMLSDKQRNEVASLVGNALDKAERLWNKHGMSLDKAIRADSAGVTKEEVVLSRIPGYTTVESGKEEVKTFIALVGDIRESSKHLQHRIASARVTELERVFYETHALLPALEKTIQYEGGGVTEYLGDGILALFEVSESERESAVRAAYNAAEDCMGDTREIVNKALGQRYELPPLNLGIGMAMSPAIVTLVGIEGNSHAKVIGKCVWYATKLAYGHNEIIVDDFIEAGFPTSKTGRLRFRRKKGRRGVEGFLVTTKPKEEEEELAVDID
jgi:class 3 adenylate cyclase